MYQLLDDPPSIIDSAGDRSLREQLIDSGRTCWLDVGCGGNFEKGFFAIDVFPEALISQDHRSQYGRVDILSVSPDEIAKLGKFDLVRMQHVLEHMTWEEGAVALTTCVKLLKPDGLILITVPDLAVHVQRYLRSEYRGSGFAGWANHRIPSAAPDSCYFSIFAHSMPYEPHKWCYDQEGLLYRLKTLGLFHDIIVLRKDSSLASIPFTHNRPDEDLCVLARVAKTSYSEDS